MKHLLEVLAANRVSLMIYPPMVDKGSYRFVLMNEKQEQRRLESTKEFIESNYEAFELTFITQMNQLCKKS